MFEGHGDDLYRYSGKIKHNFSTNILSGVDHTGLLDHLRNDQGGITCYPEPYPWSLEARIAVEKGCPEANVVVTSGAVDAIYRLASLYARCSSAISRPSFREYQDACKLYDHQISFFDSLGAIPGESDMIWLCNPDNPTGRVWPAEELLDLAGRCRETLVVIDQAYEDYTLKRVIAPEEALAAGNIVLLSSLTKRYAVPGLRIGYLIGPEELCGKIRERSLPWAISGPASSAANYLLGHTDDYRIPAVALHSEALRVSEAFRQLGIECGETDCNFILCRLPEGMKAAQFKEFLAEGYGILIRDASNFEGLDSRYFRIAAQTAAENDLLIKAVSEWMRG